ncbi:AGAP002184-PA [Anopheles gambiae str. PEST]|uniref:AGAP002184-PA n=1 Tax=Anopheles gambiae TaxID=7165 RepID=Q7QK74_ANOGA|nr:AGAP002184-PA [Anopheles gambiae str. PEST]
MELIRKKMKPYQPSEQLVVRDSVSLSMDEDLSDDVEDEVFIRDGRTCRTYEDRGAKRPLMAPRRTRYGKATSGNGSGGVGCGGSAGGVRSSSPILKKYRRRKCWKCCEPFCYGLAAVTVLIGLIVLAALLLTAFPQPLQKIKIWFHKESAFSSAVIRDKFSSLMYTGADGSVSYANPSTLNGTLEMVPCTQITVQSVWTRVIARVNSESPLRKLDVNRDGVEDVIVGYGIDELVDEGIRGYIPQCTSRKTGITDLCGGGLLALNGLDGQTLWQRWTSFTIFSLKCDIDINADGGADCVAAGRGGLILALDGRNGRILWELKDYSDLESYAEISIDLYTINVVPDLNSDGIADILAVHVEETQRAHGGHIKLISGATGAILRSIPTPYREEMFVPMQVLSTGPATGADAFLVVTGGQNSPGGVYVLRRENLMKYPGESAFEPIVRLESSGFMVPAVLTDLNGDGVQDIVVSSFNSTVYAFDGANRTQLWSFTVADSESVSSIVPGHFDHDNVTDFMVKYNTGPGFPIYYYSQTTIVNGTNGKPFLDSTIKDSGGPNGLLGGVTISQTGGGDLFLHWQTQCRNRTADTTDEYQFIPESDVIQQSRADTCALRYNQSSVLKLYAITRHVEPPGAVIFSSDDLTIRLNETGAGTAEQSPPGYAAPMKHPKMKLRSRNDGQSSATLRKNSVEAASAGGQPANGPGDDVHMDKKLAPSIPAQRPAEAVGVVVDRPGQAAAAAAAGHGGGRRKDIFREQQSQPMGQSIDALEEEEAKRQEKLALNNVYKKYIYNANDQEPGGELAEEGRGEERKPYIYLPYDQIEQEARDPYLTNQIPPAPALGGLDYDYGTPPLEVDEGRPMPVPYKRPRYRSNGRDVRSKFGAFDDIDLHDRSLEEQVFNESNPTSSQIVKKVLLNDEIVDDLKNADPGSKGSKETLWDLEMEKEAKEAMNGNVNAMNYEYSNSKARRQTGTVGSVVATAVSSTVPPPTQPPLSTSTRSSVLPNENILPSIASSGVLLKSIPSAAGTATPTTSSPTLDYVFVMNVRESEQYPPLFLDSDLACVQEKMQAYRTYRNEDMVQLEKKFFAQCLKARLPELAPQYPRYETQIIVTRVEIGCACSADLNPAREVCSQLHSYDQQRWTQYMGNEGNGRY